MARLCSPGIYERRKPEDSVLYRTLETHLERASSLSWRTITPVSGPPQRRPDSNLRFTDR